MALEKIVLHLCIKKAAALYPARCVSAGMKLKHHEKEQRYSKSARTATLKRSLWLYVKSLCEKASWKEEVPHVQFLSLYIKMVLILFNCTHCDILAKEIMTEPGW